MKNVVCYGFKVDEVSSMIMPMYTEIIDSIMRQYKIDNISDKMIINAVCDEF